ncbi:MAG: ATP-binding protein [Gammaproteobacteria bacterium]|nr:ATP-binding protein [Gammaproteobacteria bacterium]
MLEILFPSRIALGRAFCNRETERGMLVNNIQQIRHTLIISPRRYGKTSLALQAISEANVPHAYINFFNALRDEDVAKKFVGGFTSLLSTVMPTSQKALKTLAKVLANTQVSLEVKGVGASFSVRPSSTGPLETVQHLLEDIEKLLSVENKRAVIFLDEFQDIVKTEMSDLFQAELRDFAQRTQRVTFIISGSHRHMLNKIFDDRHKPFYKLCDRINLQRIKSADYEAFLQKHAKEQWKKPLSVEVIDEVLKLTENHPYYVNKICAKLWTSPSLPTKTNVDLAWLLLGEEEYDSVVNDISLLSKNQRLVLQAMSQREAVAEPNSVAMIQELKMAHSSISQSLEVLLKNDFIEQGPLGYRVVDPLIKYVLNQAA